MAYGASIVAAVRMILLSTFMSSIRSRAGTLRLSAPCGLAEIVVSPTRLGAAGDGRCSVESPRARRVRSSPVSNIGRRVVEKHLEHIDVKLGAETPMAAGDVRRRGARRMT